MYRPGRLWGFRLLGSVVFLLQGARPLPILGQIFYPMLEDFSFKWNGKKWNGFIHALSKDKIYVHFEEHELRDLFKGSLKMKLQHPHLLPCNQQPVIEELCPRLYDSILKAVTERVKAKQLLN